MFRINYKLVNNKHKRYMLYNSNSYSIHELL